MIATLLAAAALAQAAPAIPPVDLRGRTEAQVRQALGEPQIARKEVGGAMWTYRREACALFVFFTPPEAGGPLQVSSVSAGPRRRGQANPEVDACIASPAAKA